MTDQPLFIPRAHQIEARDAILAAREDREEDQRHDHSETKIRNQLSEHQSPTAQWTNE